MIIDLFDVARAQALLEEVFREYLQVRHLPARLVWLKVARARGQSSGASLRWRLARPDGRFIVCRTGLPQKSLAALARFRDLDRTVEVMKEHLHFVEYCFRDPEIKWLVPRRSLVTARSLHLV